MMLFALAPFIWATGGLIAVLVLNRDRPGLGEPTTRIETGRRDDLRPAA